MSDPGEAPSSGGAGLAPRGAVGRALDRLYDACAALAGVAMVLLLVAVLLSVVSRQLGFNVAGIDSYAGYAMAAAGFLALAHTLKKGEHIRVTLLVSATHGAIHRGLELWSLFAAAGLAIVFAGYSVRLAWQSYTFNDISTGNDATPLWLPQLAMAAGAVVFAIAFVDELVLEARGRRVVAASAEALRNE